MSDMVRGYGLWILPVDMDLVYWYTFYIQDLELTMQITPGEAAKTST